MDNENINILIVDDDTDILELIEFNINSSGYSTLTAVNGEQAIKITKNHKPNLIILDLMLPGISGLDVCKILKMDDDLQDIPIIMVTAKGDEEDIVKGLEMGADDYVTKPFSTKVLIARVKNVLKHQQESIEKDKDEIKYHEITLQFSKRQVKTDNHQIELTFTEFEILNFLLRHPGLVFTRYDIVNSIRGEEYTVTDRSVDVHVVGLRKKLGDAGKYIKTVRGVGYRMEDK